MTISRGLNRVGIVVGILVALLAVYFGVTAYNESYSKNEFVFTKEFLSYVRDKYNVEINETISKFRGGRTYRIIDYQDIVGDPALRLILNKYPELKDQDPLSTFRLYFQLQVERGLRRAGQPAFVIEARPTIHAMIEILIVTVVSAASAFIITFYGIRGLYHLTTWLIEGFKDEN